MPNRVIQDFTDNENFAKISFGAEIFFHRIFVKVDDFGCYFGDFEILNSKLFPKKGVRSIDLSDIEGWVKELESQGFITVYFVKNKRYLQIKDFKQRIRSNPKFPLPEESEMTSDLEVKTERKSVDLELFKQDLLFEIEHRKIEKPKQKIFKPPKIQEVEDYCKERNNNVNPLVFINFYQSKGWMIGKNKIKDWKACIRTWEQKNKKDGQIKTTTGNGARAVQSQRIDF